YEFGYVLANRVDDLIDYIFFFFSSRRRHTRFSRDWSSDVCSSDLPCRDLPARPVQGPEGDGCDATAEDGSRHGLYTIIGPSLGRSEERRVGKECGSESHRL